jgi:AraC-like DNA-binding protein/mannose-6-phosphate isomerase-like protein (cupin superfamily)
MKRLNEFPRGDVLSDLLSGLRVQSTVFCRSELRAPWGFEVDAQETAAFHLVVSGAAWLEAEDFGRPLRLSAGDLVILSQGQAHTMRDDRTSRVTALDDLVSGWSGDGPLRYGGAGPETELLCGGFVVDGAEVSPLLASLPDVIRIEGRRGQPSERLEATLELIQNEFRLFAPGADAIVTRLADLLLTQALRAFLSESGGRALAPLGALRDRQVAAAVALVHERPEHPWTVTELASRVAMSRSAFSARFRQLTGEPPMRFVTRYRLSRAAELLRATDRSILEIARLTGYDSAVSLTKAFTRRFGVSPGRYRRAQPTASGSASIRPSSIRQLASSPVPSERIT